MEYGNKTSFAVEFDLDKNHGGEWLYGRICFWIGGSQVGNFELGTSLRDVLFEMKYLVSDCGSRDGSTLCSLSQSDAFFAIDSLLYGDGRNARSGMPETPARFDITIPVDVFDEWKVYLFECEESARIVFKKNSETQVRSHLLMRGEFDRVINETYRNLDQLYDKEETAGSKSGRKK